MNTHDTSYDLGELVLLLNAELRAVVDSLEAQPPSPTSLQVDSLRVKMGRRSTDETAEDDESEEDVPLLDAERYPLAEDGWQIELDYALGARRAQVRVQDEATVVLPTPHLRSAARLFAPLSTTAVKGISHTWADRLAEFGIKTVGELAELRDTQLAVLIQHTDDRRPLEFRTKARLVGGEVPPLPVSRADRRSLYSLAAETPEELRALIGPALSAVDSRTLASLLAVLQTVVDSDVLRDLTLGDLRRASSET